MIRYVPLDEHDTGNKFAWLDTATDTFLCCNSSMAWESWKDFERDAVAEKINYHFFVLGPVNTPFGCFKLIENAWQFLKAYPFHFDGEFLVDGWWSALHSAMADCQASRYPYGKGAVPSCHIWTDNNGCLARLGYIEARRLIYVPLYSYCVREYAADLVREIRDLCEDGFTVWLRDFDGYDHGESSLLDCMNNPNRKFGHAFVVKAMVVGDTLEGSCLQLPLDTP